jgi:hypothetical protein
LDAAFFLYFFCLLQLLCLLLSVLHKYLLQKCDHLLVVSKLELTRLLDLLLTQLVLDLEPILHPHTQLLVWAQSLLDAPVKKVVCETKTIFTCHVLDQLLNIPEVGVLFEFHIAHVHHVIKNFYGTIFAELFQSNTGFDF